MRYLLDTNVISDITKSTPSQSLLAWMAEQLDEDLCIASLTLADIRRGILEKAAGKRRDELETWFRAQKALRPCSPAALCRSMKRRASFGHG